MQPRMAGRESGVLPVRRNGEAEERRGIESYDLRLTQSVNALREHTGCRPHAALSFRPQCRFFQPVQAATIRVPLRRATAARIAANANSLIWRGWPERS